MLEAFNAAAKRRQQELTLVERPGLTSDEEAMGITPTSYNEQNQRVELQKHEDEEVKVAPRKQVVLPPSDAEYEENTLSEEMDSA